MINIRSVSLLSFLGLNPIGVSFVLPPVFLPSLRSLKSCIVSRALDANRIYYNYLRPHTALGGKTPAEKANIDLKLGKNKWLTLIQNASKQSK